MAKTVFILGAGASRSCGGPLMVDFLDRAEALLHSGRLSTDDRGLFEAIFREMYEFGRIHAKASIDLNNVEDVFAAFEMAATLGRASRDLSDAMAMMIARTVEAGIRLPVVQDDGGDREIAAPAEYSRLARWLRQQDSPLSPPAAITFNYDLGLDLALFWEDVAISYALPTDGTRVGAVDLLKLHGSLNWVRLDEGIVAVSVRDLLDGLGPRHRSQLKREIALVDVPCVDVARAARKSADGVLPPVALIPPVWSKSGRHQELKSVWERAATALSTAEHIVVCGYSLPSSDQFFRYLFALGTMGESRIKSFHVFDPDVAVHERFRALLGAETLQRFRPHKAKFDGMVNWLEDADESLPLRSG